jgi:hypothetical protein
MKGMVSAFRLTNANSNASKTSYRHSNKQPTLAAKHQVSKPADKAAFRPNGAIRNRLDPSKLIPFDSDDQAILKNF